MVPYVWRKQPEGLSEHTAHRTWFSQHMARQNGSNMVGEAVDDRLKSRLVRADNGQRRRRVEFSFCIALKRAADVMEAQTRHGYAWDGIAAMREPISVRSE